MLLPDRLSVSMAARLITILNCISLALCTIPDTHCNITLTGLFGEIRSPNYPNQYPAGVSCLWAISVNQDYDGIVLQFKKFLTKQLNKVSSDEAFLIYTENPDVYQDLVPVRVLQGRFPSNFIFRSRSTQLWLKFQSSSAESERDGKDFGFDILYSVVTSREECGNPGIPEHGIMIGSNFTVGFHVQYYCNHGFRIQGVYQLVCVIRSLNGQPEWSDPIPLCLNTCPAPISEHLKFRGNITDNSTINFSCDPPYLLRGASQSRCTIAENGVLQWEDIPSCYIPDCTRPIVLNRLSGSIVNPAYPRHIVQGEKNCRWQIFGKPNTIIRVYFIYFDLPDDGDSYLEIKDKGRRRSTVLLRVQGRGFDARNITSRTNHVEIRYSGPRTSSTTHRGFYIRYQNLPEMPIVELEDEPHGSTRTTINMGTVTTTITSSRKPVISSSTQVIRHPDSGTDTIKIAVGVSVPLLIGLIVVFGLYLWYRKKYPVRMIMGREFAKFSNPDYQMKSSTLTLVREDADDYFHSNKDVSSLSIASEHQPIGPHYDNVGFQSDSEGSRSLSRAEEEEEEDRKLMQRKSYLFKHRDSDFTDEKSLSSDSESSESSPSRTQVHIEQHENSEDVGDIPNVDYENVDLTQQIFFPKSDLHLDDKEEKSDETDTLPEKHDDVMEETKVGRRSSTFNESPMRRFSIDPSLSVRGRSQSVVVMGEYGLIDPRLAKYSTISESIANHTGRARSMSVDVSGNRKRDVKQNTNATNSNSSGSISSKTQVDNEKHFNAEDDDAEISMTDYENVNLKQQKNNLKSDEQNINTKGMDDSGLISKHGSSSDDAEVPTTDYENVFLTQQKYISESVESYQNEDVDNRELRFSQTCDKIEQHNTAHDEGEVPSTDYENVDISQGKYISKSPDSEININVSDSDLQDCSKSVVSEVVKTNIHPENDHEKHVSSSSNEDTNITEYLDASGQHKNSTSSSGSKCSDFSMSSEQMNYENIVLTRHELISDDKTLYNPCVSSKSTDDSITDKENTVPHLSEREDHIAGTIGDSVHNKDNRSSSNAKDSDLNTLSEEQSNFDNSVTTRYGSNSCDNDEDSSCIPSTQTGEKLETNIVDSLDSEQSEYENILLKHDQSHSQEEQTAEADVPTVTEVIIPKSTNDEEVVPIPTDPGDCDQDEYGNIILYKGVEVRNLVPETLTDFTTSFENTAHLPSSTDESGVSSEQTDYENVLICRSKQSVTDSKCIPSNQYLDEVTAHASDDENYENVKIHHGMIPLTGVSDNTQDIGFADKQSLKSSCSHLQKGSVIQDTLQQGGSDTMIKDVSRSKQLTSIPIDNNSTCDASVNAQAISLETSVNLSKSENVTFEENPVLSSYNSNQPFDTKTVSSSQNQEVPACLASVNDDSEKKNFEKRQSGNQSIMVTDLDDDSSLSSFNQSFLDSSIDASSTCSNSPYMEKKMLAVSEPKVQSLPKKVQAPILDLSESTTDEYSSSDDDDNFDRTHPLGGIGGKSFPSTVAVRQLAGITEESDIENETRNSNKQHDEMKKDVPEKSDKVKLSVIASHKSKSDDGVLDYSDSSDEEFLKFTDEDILNALGSDESDGEGKQSQSYEVNVASPTVIRIGTSDQFVFGEENDDIDV